MRAVEVLARGIDRALAGLSPAGRDRLRADLAAQYEHHVRTAAAAGLLTDSKTAAAGDTAAAVTTPTPTQ